MASGGDEDKNPRPPKDMMSLLAYCAGAGQNQSSSSHPGSNEHVLDPERKEWLQEALKGLSSDHIQQMQACIDVIKTKGSDDDFIERQTQALEELIDCCDKIDFAIDFHKINGFQIFPIVLHHEEAELRSLGAELIAVLVQNNPYCQNAVLSANLLPLLLELLDKDENSTVRVKALYAVSCLCRDSQDAQKVFTDCDGFSVLMRAMQSDVEKLVIKAAFFLCHMCIDQPVLKDILCDIGMIDQLVGHLSEEHTATHEHVMGALLTIVTNHDRALQEAQKPHLNLVDLLTRRIEEIANVPEFQEETEYAEGLLKLLINTQQSNSGCAATR
ncbi:hsp70-binding protein 1-like isoform X1 [Gigantopelta aegis]|uniref:hsp70-binding protein 1-like isoform X1 n=1 Tax=Gigantopelta aegis TaxID=1735272 RepID=UPI001B88BBEF|nr:hsp70-binding protein 1-like isoform X1 [Gigantopelta aegis]XP_041365571.1 hsp70-binding protein 1-like isoform X1 [Gigantopelta aegis]XP_041365572.1 hsp70-binding protein 1-like isoform X1 [Gigantopelta aegis]XP_041365573.1 hsp70-binding protein 1-like isoform X1 [Gigantopelta aegis]XP_041365574.1 hsp70-binding protein 1-like isoform X1 [Gigantopelta aegis]